MPGQHSALAHDDVPTAQLLPLPDWAPPYDGEAGGGVLVRASPMSGNVVHVPGTPAPAQPAGLTGAQPVGDWPQWFARMLAEALAGERAARQVLPCMTKRARSQFSRLLPSFRGAGGRARGHRPRVVRVVATRPAPDVIEMSVIASFGPRMRAVAVRLERPAPEARWTCTEIEAA
jgi:hypothetical protein